MTGIPARAARAAIFLGFALVMAPDSASAFAIPDQLCGSAPSGGQDTFPSDAEMLRAADAAERRLRGVRGTGRLEGALSDLEIAPAGASVPNPEALARYCTAAGEVMRLSVEGSQLQAQTYLLTAVRAAQSAGADELTSQAAYRLGLVSLAGPPVGGARGGGGSRLRRSGTQITAESREARTEAEACASLARARLESSSNSVLSTLALTCAERQARESGDPELSARASLRLARLGITWAETASDNPEALRALALNTSVAAIPIALQIGDPFARAELTGRLIDTAISVGGAGDPAVRAGVAELQRQQHLDPAIASGVAALQAQLALADGDLPQAQALIETAIVQEAQRPLPIRLPDYYLLLAQADPAQRERHVFAAYNALENMRPLLPRTDPLTEESIFSLYMRNVFESAVEVQLAGTTQDDPARIQFAQEIVENFRQAELLSAVGTECLPPRNPVEPQDLAAGEVLLYPLLLPDRVELLYVAGGEGGARYRRLAPNRSVDRQEVSRLVEDMVFSMSYGQDEAWREPARRLYEILIKPIEDRLAPGSTLIIVPDGPLRALPFAALVADDGRFLVQRTGVSVAPALAYSQPGETRSDDSPSVVAASLQREVALPAGTFFALQGTAAEAQIAAGSGSPGQHLADFSKDQLVTALSDRPVDILHLATHASFNGRSDRAFIVANGEAIRLSELRDLIAAGRRRGDELDLLILSACETAVGDDEASMGLAGAAVQAGALSAIASLWQVDDIGTAELMRQFYSRYRTGRGRSEALRDSQLALIEAGGNNARPNVWAAFTLLGAWR